MENLGYIKLHRNLKDKGYYKNSSYVHLWVHILLSANHAENEFFWNGKSIKIKPGQFITGRKSLSSDTGISESKVQRLLKQLEIEHQIEQQITNKFRLISVVNWDKWQKDEQHLEQLVNNKRTTTEQQLNTNKNDKNVKNEKNKTLQPTVAEHEGIVKIIEAFSKLNPLISYGNKTFRQSSLDLIAQFGEEKAVAAALYAVSIQGEQFAPIISTPYQLKVKFGELVAYKKRQENNQPKGIII